jgi:hypothetical protein
MSRDPTILRSTHERFAALLPTIAACDHTFDTTTTPAARIADELAALPR